MFFNCSNTCKLFYMQISKEKKVEKFLDGQCPPSKWNQTRNTQNCTNECKNDGDCHNDYKCCTNGCSRVCKEPWFPRRGLIQF